MHSRNALFVQEAVLEEAPRAAPADRRVSVMVSSSLLQQLLRPPSLQKPSGLRLHKANWRQEANSVRRLANSSRTSISFSATDVFSPRPPAQIIVQILDKTPCQTPVQA